MINSIKLPVLRNGEYLQFMADVLSTVKQNDPKALNVQEQYDNLLALFAEIEELFKLPTGSIISSELQEIDLRRDNAINGITAAIKAYTYSADPVINSHAKLLENHLSVFGAGIAQENYLSETTTIRNLIADWDKQPGLTTAMTALGFTAWKTELEEANNLFNKRYLSRAKENGSASTDSLRTKRLESYDAYYALRDHINAYFIINKGADPFGQTVSDFNGLLENYNALLDRRVNKEPEPEVVASAVA